MYLSRLTVMLLLIFSVAQATVFNGDGIYEMEVDDVAVSSNGFEVLLTDVTWHEGVDGIVLDEAVYAVSLGNKLVDEPSLAPGEVANVSKDEKSVIIRVRNLEYEPPPLTHLAYYSPKYYAVTLIDSETRPVEQELEDMTLEEEEEFHPDVFVESIMIFPSNFSSFVTWDTNLPANETLMVFNESSSVPVKEYSSSSLSETHSVNVTGLKSDTDYLLKIRGCTESDCDEETADFTTLPVIPEISEVEVVEATNDSAIISWKTNVISDSRVYYRELGTSEWSVIPVSVVWTDIKKYFIFELSDDSPEPISFSGESAPRDESQKEMVSFSGDSLIGDMEITEEFDISDMQYEINSNYIQNVDLNSIPKVITQIHQMKLYNLKPETTYQFKVSSCADRCANSSIGTFDTEYTVMNPYASFISPDTEIEHGTSLVLPISAYSRNPNGHLTDVELAWNDGGVKTLTPVFGGDQDSFLATDLFATLSTISMVSITFEHPGNHHIELTVTDNYSKTTVESLGVYVSPNDQCADTNAMYYPFDTGCTDQWPHDAGPGIDYNNGIGACHAFEVCDPGLDYMIADAESCCNGERDFSSKPIKNAGYNYDKNLACDIAIQNTKDKADMFSLTSDAGMKLCKANYLVYGVGSQAIYMKDYYTAETCCKDTSFCEDYPHYQAWDPWPQSNIKFNELWCYWNDYWIFGKSPKDGWYGSDTNPESNNNALADIPAHASVNRMNTGTCVDYSFVVTTALRKAGFASNEIMSVRTPGHLYNLVWLPGNGEYSFIDTVGNNGGDFFTGPGWSWDSGSKKNLDHCQYTSNQCSNDLGGLVCPPKSMVSGC